METTTEQGSLHTAEAGPGKWEEQEKDEPIGIHKKIPHGNLKNMEEDS